MQPMQRNQFTSAVLASVPLCREHYRLVLRLPHFPKTEPGQFIQISCRDLDTDYSPQRELDWQPGQMLDLAGRELMSPLALLRRPFSLAGRRDTPAGVELDIIHRIVGVGTDWLSRLTTRDKVFILGPLGNRFDLPPANTTAVLVGGGVGIPPMLYLAQKLARHHAVAFCGALTRDLLPLTITDGHARSSENVEPIPDIEEFTRHNIPSVISTDDGSYGYRGYVTQALEAWLEGSGFRVQGSGKTAASLNPEPRTLNPLSPHILYTCGPEPMMKRVADIAASRGLECQIAVERAMACGMGTCQSCCIRVRKSDPRLPPLPGSEWCYRLACADGPIFRGAELLW